jgi:acyl-CoA synthetase (AMP-forming)/AMP-acid ligase II
MTTTSVAMVIPELLERRAAEDPAGVALNVEAQRVLRFGEWQERSLAVAHALLTAGVGRGSRVGLLFSGTDWIDYAVAYLGVLRAGASGVHVNDKLSAGEIDRRLSETGASYLIYGAGGLPATLVRFTGPAVPLTVLAASGPVTSTGPLPVSVSPGDIADVHYTSGTTGPAKAYTVPHANVTFGRDPATMRNFTAGGSMLVPMQPGSSSAASSVLAAVISPMTSVLCSPDDVEHAARLIARLGVSALAITPWFASQLVAARVSERHDLSTVRMIACASAPLPAALARALLAMMPGARLTGAFSQSEASPALLVSVFDPNKPLAVGRPNASTELLLVDDAGEPVPTGELGQIWLRHAAPRRLYLDPARNATLLADGWYRTGDYGSLGEDGDLFFFDRGADLIETAAGRVSSLAVEAELYEHPAVREAAVVAAPGAGGTRVVAFVALTDPAALDPVRALAAERLAPHQRPQEYVLVEALPRSDKGKVLKRELRRTLT